MTTNRWIAAVLGLVLAGPAAAHKAAAQTVAAVIEAEHALTAANDKTPLTLNNAILVEDKAPRFGTYQQRPSNRYQRGETVLMYAEPVGLRHEPDGDLITVGLTVDLLLKRGDTIIYGKENFINADFPSHHALQEIMLNGSLSLNIGAGTYDIELVTHDHNSGQTAHTTLPIVIEDDEGTVGELKKAK